MIEVIDLVIIDNDQEYLIFLKNILYQYKINFKIFENGEEALEQVVTSPPRLIFMGHKLPKLTSEKFIIKISENCLFQHTSVYLVSQHNFISGEIDQLMTLGFSQIIQKPIDETLIRNILTKELKTQLNNECA